MHSQLFVQLEVLQPHEVYAVEWFVELAFVTLENAVVGVDRVDFEFSLVVVLFLVVTALHFEAVLGQFQQLGRVLLVLPSQYDELLVVLEKHEPAQVDVVEVGEVVRETNNLLLDI